jgi:hypothetical protein
MRSHTPCQVSRIHLLTPGRGSDPDHRRCTLAANVPRLQLCAGCGVAFVVTRAAGVPQLYCTPSCGATARSRRFRDNRKGQTRWQANTTTAPRARP